MNQDGLRRIVRAEKVRQKKTWKGISRKSGVAYSTIGNFLMGERDTSMNVILRLLDELGLELCVRRKKNDASENV